MSALLVGYARCSTDQQDLTAQREALSGLGVETERIYVDHGLTGMALSFEIGHNNESTSHTDIGPPLRAVVIDAFVDADIP